MKANIIDKVWMGEKGRKGERGKNKGKEEGRRKKNKVNESKKK